MFGYTIIKTKRLKELENGHKRMMILEANMYVAYRWLAEFDIACEVIDWIRNGTQEISNFRDKLRSKTDPKTDKQ